MDAVAGIDLYVGEKRYICMTSKPKIYRKMKSGMTIRCAAAVLLSVLVAAVSCRKASPKEDPVLIESITLPESITLKEGNTQQIEAVILPENATNQQLIWVTFNDGIATVTDGGVVTAVSEGVTVVAAYAGDGTAVKGECEVTVTPRVPPGAVDLGLSVFWASCNVGASRPEEVGSYFSWGGVITHPDNSYTWSDYEWCNNGSTHSFTRYNTDNMYGTNDGWVRLIASDDAVTYEMKGKGAWRMPTEADFNELIDLCSVSWKSLNGVDGALLTGPNGNTIFFPLSGKIDEYGKNSEAFVYLWSSDLGSNIPTYAKRLIMSEIHYPKGFVGTSYRYFGLNVRGVCPTD